MSETIETTRFPNGLTVLSDRMPDVRSATIGFFFKTGARHEPEELSGISHFIEHAVFKGTRKRSALDIAIETDRLGGSFDAFTMHEETGFAMKVIDTELPKAFELLADLLTDPRFDEVELKREQKVIIEEIKMTDDSPEEYIHELFNEKLFPGHSLGRPIAGKPKTVRSFDHELTSRYHRENFVPRNLIIAAAGNVTHDRVIELSAKHFEGGTDFADHKTDDPELSSPIVIKKDKTLEQAHLIISTPFVSARDERRYAADILSNALGGGTSSRLWQKVREQKGLAYSVGASAAMYQDCGVFTIFAGTSPRQTEQILKIALGEMRSIVRNGISNEELELMKAQTVSSILLGLEDSANRASTLARLEMVHGRQISLEETLQRVNAVTIDEVRAIAHEFFQTEKVGFGALGNLNGLKITRDRLAI